jgi:ATP-binding cassette, subfamily B, bacterial
MSGQYRQTWASWRGMAGRFRPYKLQMLAELLIAILSTVLTVVGPLLLVKIINDPLRVRNTRLLTVLCLLLLAVGVITSLTVIAQNALTNWVGQRVLHGMREDLYDTVQRKPIGFFSTEANSEIQARIVSDIGGISDIVTYTAQSAINSLTSLAALAVVMFLLSWPLAVASLVLGTLLNTANTRFAKKRQQLAALRQQRVSAMILAVDEDLSMPGMILGRTFGRQVSQRSRFTELSNEVATLTYQQRLAGNSARTLIGITLGCVPPLIYWLSGTVFTSLSLGTVVVLAMLQFRLSGPIQQLLGLSANVQSATAMIDRVSQYLNPDAELESAPASAPAISVPRRPPYLRVENVSYRYPSSRKQVLCGVDLEFAPGTVSAITGATGGGKTTLALILSGMMPPTSGTVRADHQVQTVLSLRSIVTIVSQDMALLNASVRDNLLFAKPDATADELGQVLRQAQLEDWLSALPDGMNTMIGERGFVMSGGERQRLALARAMLSESPILILDEALSALDVETSRAASAAIRQFCDQRTLIMIGHNMPFIAATDRIIVVEGGHAVDTDTANSERHATDPGKVSV